MRRSNISTPMGEIAEKMRRALRNGTGMTMAHDQVVTFMKSPLYMLVAEKEREELLAHYAPSIGEEK